MRISDWSSDVCSSDLKRAVSARQYRRTPACAGFGHPMSAEAGAVVTDASDFAPGSGLLRQSRFRLQAHAHLCTGIRKAAEGNEYIRRVEPAVTCKAVIHRLVSRRQNGANVTAAKDARQELPSGGKKG